MITVLISFFVICLVLIIKSFTSSKEKTEPNNETRYSRSKNYMDFDAGTDSNKIGDSKYPTAVVDSVMKHEFLNELTEDKK